MTDLDLITSIDLPPTETIVFEFVTIPPVTA
jgi:hypothetical protein